MADGLEQLFGSDASPWSHPTLKWALNEALRRGDISTLVGLNKIQPSAMTSSFIDLSKHGFNPVADNLGTGLEPGIVDQLGAEDRRQKRMQGLRNIQQRLRDEGLDAHIE